MLAAGEREGNQTSLPGCLVKTLIERGTGGNQQGQQTAE